MDNALSHASSNINIIWNLFPVSFRYDILLSGIPGAITALTFKIWHYRILRRNDNDTQVPGCAISRNVPTFYHERKEC
jgi:hypothetical protein